MLSHISRWIYSALLLFATLFWYLPRQMLRIPGYHRTLTQRLALSIPQDMQGCLWVHAVSLGEVNAISPLVQQLIDEHPQLKILLSTTTQTGAEQVTRRFGARLHHVFCPWDLPGAMRRFLHKTKPQAVVLVETELWPNMIHQCQRMQIPILLLNARLSADSARGYAYLRNLSKMMFGELAAVAAQTQEEGERFCKLGLPPQNLHICGNLKFDIEPLQENWDKAEKIRQYCGNRPIWVAGSTHDGEDSTVLEVCNELWKRFPELLLVLVPRHPERFEAVATECARAVPDFVRYSSGLEENPGARLLLVDTIGDLPKFLAAANFAFIGGSLRPSGGHNMLEAAVWSVPVLCGPYLFNFQEAADLLEECGALVLVRNAEEMQAAAEHWLDNPEKCVAAGMAGATQLQEKRGSLAKQVALVEKFLNRD